MSTKLQTLLLMLLFGVLSNLNSQTLKTVYYPNETDPDITFKINNSSIWEETDGVFSTESADILINKEVSFIGDMQINIDEDEYSFDGTFLLNNIIGSEGSENIEFFTSEGLGFLNSSQMSIESQLVRSPFVFGNSIIPHHIRFEKKVDGYDLFTNLTVKIPKSKDCSTGDDLIMQTGEFGIERYFGENSSEDLKVSIPDFSLDFASRSHDRKLCFSDAEMILKRSNGSLVVEADAKVDFLKKEQNINFNLSFINDTLTTSGLSFSEELPYKNEKLSLEFTEINKTEIITDKETFRLNADAELEPDDDKELFMLDGKFQMDLTKGSNIMHSKLKILSGDLYYSKNNPDTLNNGWVGKGRISQEGEWNRSLNVINFPFKGYIGLRLIDGPGNKIAERHVIHTISDQEQNIEKPIDLTISKNADEQLMLSGESNAYVSTPTLFGSQSSIPGVKFCEDQMFKELFYEFPLNAVEYEISINNYKIFAEPVKYGISDLSGISLTSIKYDTRENCLSSLEWEDRQTIQVAGEKDVPGGNPEKIFPELGRGDAILLHTEEDIESFGVTIEAPSAYIFEEISIDDEPNPEFAIIANQTRKSEQFEISIDTNMFDDPVNIDVYQAFGVELPNISIKYKLPEELQDPDAKIISLSWTEMHPGNTLSFYLNQSEDILDGMRLGSFIETQGDTIYEIPDDYIKCSFFISYRLFSPEGYLLENNQLGEYSYSPDFGLAKNINSKYYDKSGKTEIKWDITKFKGIEGFFVEMYNDSSLVYAANVDDLTRKLVIEFGNTKGNQVYVTSYDSLYNASCTVASTVIAGVNDKTADNNSIKIYPNPAGDHVIIKDQNRRIRNAELSLHNIKGEKIKKIKGMFSQENFEKGVRINTSGIRTGMYLISIKYRDKIIMKKVIIK